jgi:AbrB family looped-hinge helix DNA binding protein
MSKGRQSRGVLDVEASKVGKRGTVVIPAVLRRRFGIEEGSMVIAEPREDGILLRPAAVMPIEIYPPERKAQFLLSNAVDRRDYEQARRAVRAMDLDPDRVSHYKPNR